MAVKENPDGKKASSALRHVRKDFRSMMRQEHLNFFETEVLIRQKLFH